MIKYRSGKSNADVLSLNPVITVPPTFEHAAEVMCAGKDSVENTYQVACADKGTVLQGTTQSSCYGVTTNEHAAHTVPVSKSLLISFWVEVPNLESPLRT